MNKPLKIGDIVRILPNAKPCGPLGPGDIGKIVTIDYEPYLKPNVLLSLMLGSVPVSEPGGGYLFYYREIEMDLFLTAAYYAEN